MPIFINLCNVDSPPFFKAFLCMLKFSYGCVLSAYRLGLNIITQLPFKKCAIFLKNKF